MAVAYDHVQKTLRKLRKSLKSIPKNPSAEEVHKLRTQTRRLEAIVSALALDQEKETRHLLDIITPVRKAAGDVRDMDVLIGKVLTLSKDGGDDTLVQLIEHLSGKRIEKSLKLFRRVSSRQKNARHRLKHISRRIKRKFSSERHSVKAKGKDDWSSSNVAAAALKLGEELGGWPELNAGNLHPFRIKAKKLRYILQLAEDPNTEFVISLGEIKDEIGDWHDWLELTTIAGKVLDSKIDGEVLQQIKAIEQRTFQQALTTANKMRTNDLSRNLHRKRGKTAQQVRAKESFLEAAAKLTG